MKKIAALISEELGVRQAQVDAAVQLLDEGATVPFISRYRKEVTGGLDDVQLRRLEDRLGYLRELEERRQVILRSIEEQGKLTDTLREAIEATDSKVRLEDLYLPYKPKRRTKAQIAREAGLEPVADGLLGDPRQVPEVVAAAFVDTEKGVGEVKAALDGARQILMERFAEDPELAGELRAFVWDNAVLQSRFITGKEKEGAKFADYFDFKEPLKSIPSHRALALLRGRNEGVLALELTLTEDQDRACQGSVARRFSIRDQDRPADPWLLESVRLAWKAKLFTRLDLELKSRVREAAEGEAIRVFAANLKDLLLAAPAGRLPILGLDPGLRTGVKVAVVDATSKVVATDTIYPHAPHNRWDASVARLAQLAASHGVRLISIGNGTASRETDRLARDLIKRHPELDLRAVVVNEAGASVYSASEQGSQELPDLDVSLRGAVSIARRLQDPLAELVKIEPKSIGVGQYQHDVNQIRLAQTLQNVVVDCVNAVGIDVNTASVPLLSQVSGLNRSIAENLVRYRDEHGPFRTRDELKRIPRLGEKTFQQAAGFMRIPNGRDPLDASAVHPEAYPVVQRILAHTGLGVRELIGKRDLLRALDPARFTDAQFGEPTVRDILAELEKPGRDPRPELKTATFREGVESLSDLRAGMVLEGTVTNVANFGAFVDLGVHQDGLVHVSALAERFVKDPRQVVKAGDVVRVKVLEVDLERRRIALSMRLGDETSGVKTERREPLRQPRPGRQQKVEPAAGTMAEAFARARRTS